MISIHSAALIRISFRRAMRNRPLTDEERFVLRLVERHTAERRFDLVAEDLAFLGRRLEGAA